MAQRAYFGLGFVSSLLLAILPLVSSILGIIICFQREQYKFAVIRIVGLLVFPVFWILDIINICVNKDLVWLA